MNTNIELNDIESTVANSDDSSHANLDTKVLRTSKIIEENDEELENEGKNDM